jgi:GNAT superfamily N-acetyltransferase
MADVRIRALTLRDTERILDIDAAVTGTPHKTADNDLWRLIAETTTCYGAEVGGRLIGFVLADVRPWEFGNRAHVGWIISLGVDPAHQHQGVGMLLGDKVLASFRALGVTHFKTLVGPESAGLLPYFKRLGFKESSERVLALSDGTRGATRPRTTERLAPARPRARRRKG